MSKIGFRTAKRLLVAALESGDYAHELDRGSIETKNLLATGRVSADEVLDLVAPCRGQNHSSSAHHFDARIEVHILKINGWYIKFYVLGDPSVMFISVHQ